MSKLDPTDKAGLLGMAIIFGLFALLFICLTLITIFG